MTKRFLFLSASVQLLVLACGSASSSPRQSIHAPTPAAAASPTAFAFYGTPVRLKIAKLNIDAQVEQVTTDKNGRMDVPKDYHDVAWYAQGVRPGQNGDAVMAGHLDWIDHGRTVPAVFAQLGSLAPGDQIEIVTGFANTTIHFSVVESKSIPYDADPAKLGMFDTAGQPRLTLVTCAGDFSQQIHQYRQRQVVTANLVKSG